jgi:hypothetical protein
MKYMQIKAEQGNQMKSDIASILEQGKGCCRETGTGTGPAWDNIIWALCQNRSW